jgi:hypothetical protein
MVRFLSKKDSSHSLKGFVAGLVSPSSNFVADAVAK